MTIYSALSSDDYATFRARLAMDAYRAIVSAFQAREAEGLTRQQLASFLGVHKSVVSRRLNGVGNLTLGVISDMARAMGYRPELTFTKYESLVGDNANPVVIVHGMDTSASEAVHYTYVDKSTSSEAGIPGMVREAA